MSSTWGGESRSQVLGVGVGVGQLREHPLATLEEKRLAGLEEVV